MRNWEKGSLSAHLPDLLLNCAYAKQLQAMTEMYLCVITCT